MYRIGLPRERCAEDDERIMKLLTCAHPQFGRGDDTVGSPHRAEISPFELFELVLLLRLDKQFPVQQFEAMVSQSTVPSPLLTVAATRLEARSGSERRIFCSILLSVKKIIPPEKKTREDIGFENTRSGAGEQLLLLGFRARAY